MVSFRKMEGVLNVYLKGEAPYYIGSISEKGFRAEIRMSVVSGAVLREIADKCDEVARKGGVRG